MVIGPQASRNRSGQHYPHPHSSCHAHQLCHFPRLHLPLGFGGSGVGSGAGWDMPIPASV